MTLVQADKIKAFILKSLPDHPQDIVAVTSKKFKVTRTTVHRHLNALIKQNKLIKAGATRQTTYYLSSHLNRKYTFSLKEGLSEMTVWERYLEPQFQGLSRSVMDILHYGFTEMFNNALDHAQATHIEVSISWQEGNITISLSDNGLGVFKRINNYFHFGGYRECLLHLTKGKLTTDPSRHTGEGLFFTSRAFDHFYLVANGLCFHRDNTVLDWAMSSLEEEPGTKIIMEISQTCTRKLMEIFNKYTDDHEFTKTDLLVDLSQFEGEKLISRSQAKRLFTKIEPFNSVTLDFAKVITIGQGFADEVFRIYPSTHPNTQINYINANKDVDFMIKRSIPKMK